MKENTKRVLLWLYPITTGQRWVKRAVLREVTKDITDKGFSSLLYLLKKNQLVVTKKIDGESFVSITSHGEAALEDEIPVFSKERREWNGNWSIILFLQAPKGDERFRYLRKTLISSNAVGISRGVYLYPGLLPPQVQVLISRIYKSSVVIFQSNEMLFGDANLLIGSKTTVSDQLEVYSGISREIDALIKKKNEKKDLKDASKTAVYSVFNRLYEAIELDVGLVRLFFPQVKDGVQLLDQLRNLI